MRNRRPGTEPMAGAASLICLLAIACGPGEPAGTQEMGESQSGPAEEQRGESDADHVFATDEAFNKATQELGIEGWLDFFATDGRMIVDGAEIVGREAIGEAMEPYLSAVRLEWRPTRAVARAGSELAYTVGSYRATPRERPDSLLGTGTYVTIWERQGDGSWKVSLDTGSPHPEPRP